MKRHSASSSIIDLVGRFGRNRDGVTAVEFSLLAIPFFLCVFAILETALVMFAGLTLANTTTEAARVVRTGEAFYKKYTADQFRQVICRDTLNLFDCDKLRFDLRKYGDYAAMPTSAPVVNGELDDNDFGYETGSPNAIMMLRVYYKWPIVTDLMHKYLSNMNDDTFLLSAVSAVRIEPLDVD